MSTESLQKVNNFYRGLFIRQEALSRTEIPSASDKHTILTGWKKDPAFDTHSALCDIAFFPYLSPLAWGFSKKLLIALSIIPVLPVLTIATMALALAIALIASVLSPFVFLAAALTPEKKKAPSELHTSQNML